MRKVLLTLSLLLMSPVMAEDTTQPPIPVPDDPEATNPPEESCEEETRSDSYCTYTTYTGEFRECEFYYDLEDCYNYTCYAGTCTCEVRDCDYPVYTWEYWFQGDGHHYPLPYDGNNPHFPNGESYKK